jgi:hypothetical protein
MHMYGWRPAYGTNAYTRKAASGAKPDTERVRAGLGSRRWSVMRHTSAPKAGPESAQNS